MNQLITKLIVALTICLVSANLFGQREVTLYMMENVYQSSYVNPAVIPQSAVSIGLPVMSSLYVGQALSFSGRDVIEGNVISPTKLINNTDKGVWTNTFVNTDIFSARVKVKNWYFNFSARARAYQKIMLDKDMLDLAWNGNASMLGEEVSLENMANDGTAYTEIGLGATKEFGKWVFGAKLKANFGILNISNSGNDTKLYFDPNNYEASLNGAYIINTSTIPHVDDGRDLEPADFLKLNTDNFGLGIDLGASYKLSDRVKLSASVVDLGYIKWDDSPQNYNLSASGVLKGADAIGAIIEGADSDSVWTAWAESLEAQTDYTSTQNSYTTKIHSQMYLNGQYKIGEKLDAYATVNMFLWQGLRTSVTGGLRKEFGRSFSMTLNNTIQYKRFVNVGLGFMVKPGPVQLYMVFDNIFMGNFVEYKNAGAPIPDYITNVNMRFGINLVFGKVQGEDKIL
jgi:hypothetical protein